jgi:PST family polysaccharide transporter
LLRGGAVVVAANVLQKLVGLVFVALLARELGVEEFGQFSFAIAYGAFFQTVADLGLDMVATRELAAAHEAEEGRIIGSALAAKAVAVLLSLLGAAGATLLFPLDLRVVALIAALTALADLPSTFALPLLARVRTLGPVFIQTIGVTVSAAALVASAWAGISVRWLVVIQVVVNIATGLALALYSRHVRASRLEVDRATVHALVKLALPLALSTFAVVVFVRIDQLMLGALGDVEDVGRYAVAVKVVEALNVVPIALAAVVLPTLSHLQQHEPDKATRLLETAFRLQAAVMLPLAALGTVGGGVLLAGLFGESYRGAGPVLALLLWAHYFASSWVIARQALIVVGRTGVLAALAILAAVLNVSLNLWLIPAYGTVGAGWASLIAYAATIFVGSSIDAVAQPFRACLAASVRPAISAGVVLALLAAVRPWPILLVVAFLLVAPAALFLTRSLEFQELKGMVVSFRSER